MRIASRSEWPWLSLAVSATCLLLVLLPESLLEHLSGDRQAILRGDLWRLWTGHLAHFSLRHALFDSLTLLLVGAMAESTFGSRRIALLLLVGAPLISVGALVVSRALYDYRGASAVTVLLATVVSLSLWRARRSSRPILGFLALCLIAKIAFDAVGTSVTLTDLPEQVHIAWQAHLLGIVLGGLWYFSYAHTLQASVVVARAKASYGRSRWTS